MTIQLLGKNLEKAVLNGKKLEEVWYNGKKVRPTGWQPGPNTLAYYPLKENANDYSGKNNHAIATNVLRTLYSNIPCAKFNSNAFIKSNIGGYDNFCISLWAKVLYVPSYNARILTFQNKNVDYQITILNGRLAGLYWSGYNDGIAGSSEYINGWNHCVLMKNGNTIVFYLNGSYIGTTTIYGTTALSNGFCLGKNAVTNSQYYNGLLSEVIVENIGRTPEEILEYYNNTKRQFGL